MSVNAVRKVNTTAHKSFEGGTIYSPSSPLAVLQMIAASSFFGEPQFYRDKDGNKNTSVFSTSSCKEFEKVLPNPLTGSPKQIMEKVIDDALNFNAEETLKLAAELRNKDNIRVTPQVILTRAAHNTKVKGTGLIRKYADQIILRGDEPATGLAYHLSEFSGKALPNSLKKVWKEYLEKQTDYTLAKYRMENRVVKTVDVVNLVHAFSDSVNKLVKGELKNTGETWEAIISEKGSTKEAWTEAVSVMGHMALLRNLRNLEQKEVDQKLYLNKLIETAEKGKQIPFRYLSAYDELRKVGARPQILDAVEQCLENSLGNLPRFKGVSISLVDNSGSMWSEKPSKKSSRVNADIANLMGVITGKCSDEGYCGIWASRYAVFPVMKKDSILSQTKELNKIGQSGIYGHGTDLKPFFEDAIRTNKHYDNIFVYSDMQLHRYVYDVIKQYRNNVNPKVMIYLVQVAGYGDTIVPEFYNRVFSIGGWSSGILNFAAKMNEIFE